jgi:chromosome segregation ATPase
MVIFAKLVNSTSSGTTRFDKLTDRRHVLEIKLSSLDHFLASPPMACPMSSVVKAMKQKVLVIEYEQCQTKHEQLQTRYDIFNLEKRTELAGAEISAMKHEQLETRNKFEAVNTDFEAVKTDFKAVKNDFKAVKTDFEAVKNDFESVRAMADENKATLAKIEDIVNKIKDSSSLLCATTPPKKVPRLL